MVDMKTLYKIENTVHTRDTRMTKAMISSKVTTGTQIVLFSSLVGLPRADTSSEGGKYGDLFQGHLCSKSFEESCRYLEEGCPVSSVHQSRIDQPVTVLFKRMEGDCN